MEADEMKNSYKLDHNSITLFDILYIELKR